MRTTIECSVDELLARSLIDFSLATNNKQMFEELQAGTYQLVKAELVPEVPVAYDFMGRPVAKKVKVNEDKLSDYLVKISWEADTYREARGMAEDLFLDGHITSRQFNELVRELADCFED